MKEKYKRTLTRRGSREGRVKSLKGLIYSGFQKHHFYKHTVKEKYKRTQARRGSEEDRIKALKGLVLTWISENIFYKHTVTYFK